MSDKWYVHWREYNTKRGKYETHSRPFNSEEDAQDKASELRSGGKASSVRVQSPKRK